MLILKREFFERIISQSKKEFPNEACGILAGPPSPVNAEGKDRLRRITKVYEMTNIDKSPETYFMDAKEQLKVMKEMRNLGLDMLAIYHSHVASPARPSAHDIEMAFYSEVSYVIVSLENKEKPNIRSFRIVGGKVEEEEVKIVYGK